ncbi:PTS-dependent dihydroxyacetone kinase operon regulator (sigma-54 dependent transcriptional regulator) [Escherichia coli]|uniref:PTS-dependent dihydroxyacetone kinase operon regulator (Sigma-54 dependent transcriptional regulator) n=1 Tax=Escherichia coli TaxID=562 RepID=A0A484WRR2_ECOLX|nr:PTS-dependent dihydroxyacetone kinase operon regulator (sigma-54 dependent transcriptional regulator) [Escherichia coli]
MLVEQNRFSRQLYYALHAFEITIPATAYAAWQHSGAGE